MRPEGATAPVAAGGRRRLALALDALRERIGAAAAAAGGSFGALPLLAFAFAAALALVSIADALSRTGHRGGPLLFWLAAVLIVAPATLRMLGSAAPRRERIATVVLLGLALYGIKVLQNPFAFTYADELVHLHNVQAILGSGHLFNGNSLLPITPRYPGLEALTVAVVRACGISPFAAGLIVIGCARAVMMVALYLLYELVGGSPRAAGLGVVVYAATPTFLFFTAEFSYESLALPVAVVSLYAMVRSIRSSDRVSRWRWAALGVLIASAVVVTHHITTYVLVLFVIGLGLINRLRRRERTPWAAAAAITALAGVWLAFAAGGTIDYLSPVVGSALDKVVATLNGASPTRVLFANQGGVETTPAWERGVAAIGIVLLVIAVVAGLRVVWARWRDLDPVVLVLAFAAIAYVGTLPLRFVPAAWETASRAGEFLFVGVALSGSVGTSRLIAWTGRSRRLRRLPQSVPTFVAVAALTLIFASGVIAGWPASLRLGLPLRVKAAGRTIEPPGYVAARWSGRVFGSRPRVAAEDTDARLFLAYAHQVAFTDDNPNIDGMLSAGGPLVTAQRKLLASLHVNLLETDRRTVATDIIAGYFFDVGRPSLTGAGAADKFSGPAVDRVLAGGSFAIYGVRDLW